MKKKIAMVFDGLQIGGIERVGLNYIRIFQNLGYEVDVYNLRPKLADLEREISESCHVIHIDFPRWMAPERYAAAIKKAWWGKFVYPSAFFVIRCFNVLYYLFIRMTQKEIRKKYDIAIAFSGHINDLTFVTDSFVSSKKIAWLHGALYGYAILSPAYLRLYSKLKNLVSLSNMCDADFYKFIQEYNINKKTIYNPITIEERIVDSEIVSQLKQEHGDFCLMVARMGDDKDQKTLIDAMKILNSKYHLYKKLLLVGDGKNRKKLEEYVKQNAMEEQVIFVGQSSDVQNYYSAASIYVHSSPLEGLPTVLLEAMNYHLPIASTDSIPGVREILQNERCGLISDVFDADGLADNIYRLYMDKKLSGYLVENGKKRLEAFRPEFVQKKIESFFAGLR